MKTMHLLLCLLAALSASLAASAEETRSATALIESAIAKGVPIFNRGDHAGCARVYEAAARELLALGGEKISPLDRGEVEVALAREAADDRARAWNLRHAFDRILDNDRFEPYLEAPLPEGFPGPGPLGRVVVKSYPRYRAARAEGVMSFWTLFRHIKKKNVQMTAPVEMTMSDELREMDMAFLYEEPEQGEAVRDGRVQVIDHEPMTVLSVGMRGDQPREAVSRARDWIEDVLEREGWTRAGSWRVLGYNSPMVSDSRRFWELQLPVTRKP
jgi:hypothetical protein